MQAVKLFLGILRDASLDEEMQNSNEYLISYFTKGGDFLHPCVIENKAYLGKPLPSLAPLEDILSLEKNIVSLLKKVAPNKKIDPESLVLLSYLDES